jgi:alanyl-tRNA synthetase
MADVLRQKLGSGVVVLGTREEEKVSVVVTVTPDLTARVDAGRLAKRLGVLMGGAGGGRSDFAQAGGKDPGRLAAALEAVPAAVEGQLRGEATSLPA